MMTTDIQAAVERLREALGRERGAAHLESMNVRQQRPRDTDAALAEVVRLVAESAPTPMPSSKRDEVLTLGRLESLLLRAELAGGSPAAALRDAVQKELR